MVKNDEYYVQKIIDDLSFVVENTKDVTIDEMIANQFMLDSIMFRIIQISENNNKLSATFKEKHKEMPWAAIKGMRNIIVHDYGIINYEMVYDAVNNKMPIMLKELLDTKN